MGVLACFHFLHLLAYSSGKSLQVKLRVEDRVLMPQEAAVYNFYLNATNEEIALVQFKAFG